MFNYYQPTRIHFGVDRLEEIGKISKKYGQRVMLVSTNDEPLQALYKRVVDSLEAEGLVVYHFDEVVPNPTLEVVESGIAFAREHDVEFLLAVGGGSSIDTAKAIAFTAKQSDHDWDAIFAKYDSPFEQYESLETSLPILSIPTTSGTGSQVTQASVITTGKEKLTFFHPDLFSKECIVDPRLMTTLPKRMSAATGFDTFTHAFESYVNGRGSYYSKMDSMAAMKLVIEFLPLALNDLSNVEYREKLALADSLGGRALANAGADTPHPLSEIMGGVMPIPHGEALAIVYPAYINHSLSKHEAAFGEVAKLFGDDFTAQDLEACVTELLVSLGLNRKMSDYDMSEADFSEIVSHPALSFLPFGSREYFVEILNDSK